MKTIKSLKLNQIERVALKEREMNTLLGGECCGCGCHGPSSNRDNAYANWGAGYSQSQGGEQHCACWGETEWSGGW
jgi:natural product precursor